MGRPDGAWSLSKLFSRIFNGAAPPEMPAVAARGGGAEPPQRTESSPPRAPFSGEAPTPPFDLNSLREAGAEVVEPLKPEELQRIDALAQVLIARTTSDTARLPAFPVLAQRIFQMVQRRDVNVNELVRLISQEPVISAEVLKHANSAFFDRGVPVETVRGAVVRLGLSDVTSIAAGAATRSLFDADARAAQSQFATSWAQLWRHATSCALGASWLALNTRLGEPSRLFIGGLLHDIGKTCALKSLGSLVVEGELDRKELSPALVSHLVEKIHVDVGILALGVWDLPSFVTELCRRHHERELPASPEHEDLHLLRVASGLDDLRTSPLVDPDLPLQVEESIAALRLTPFQLRALVSEMKQHAQRSAG